MKVEDVLTDLEPAPGSTQEGYDVLIEDASGSDTDPALFEIEEVRWQHNEKRVYIKMGNLVNDSDDDA